MKFGKLFEEVLDQEKLPAEWLVFAIRYKELKKIINQAVSELHSLGLDRGILDAMTDDYVLENDKKTITPRLVVKLEQNNSAFNTKLIEQLIDKDIPFELATQHQKIEDLTVPDSPLSSEKWPKVLTIHLTRDSVFFHTLYEELMDLSRLETLQEKSIVLEIENIGREVSACAHPNDRRSDMYIWREIIKIFVDLDIYKGGVSSSSAEVSTITRSREMLEVFSCRCLELSKKFKQKKSMVTLNRFCNANDKLIKLLNFQLYNNIAIRKILKKFDKQTSLKAQQNFSAVASVGSYVDANMSKHIVSIISMNILSVTPQLDDYTCPICMSISFKPIRLKCDHVFCIRCLVKLQRMQKDNCPLCRQPVVISATAENVDGSLLLFLKQYFPREVKSKQNQTEKEIARERYEAVYGTDSGCLIV